MHHSVTSVLDMREVPENLDPRMPKNHNTVTIVLCIEAEADDLGLHHHDTTIAQDTEEEVDDPDLHDIHTTAKTTKSRWGVMLYSQNLQNASSQRIQTTS
jgi:hypothetical protein